MIALLDANMLIAMFDGAHENHQAAHDWMRANRSEGWATCPLTQNACIRIISQPRYPGRLEMTDIAQRVRKATSSGDHYFWPDSISLSDANRFRYEHITSPKHLTDVYLLALAVEHDGRLVTFDRGISITAVVGAEAQHLAVL
jgi:hypothetical protein